MEDSAEPGGGLLAIHPAWLGVRGVRITQAKPPQAGCTILEPARATSDHFGKFCIFDSTPWRWRLEGVGLAGGASPLNSNKVKKMTKK